MSDDDEKAMLSTTFCFLAVTEVSLGPRYFVRCHVQFFLIPCLSPSAVDKHRKKLPAPFLFCLSFLLLQGLKKKNFFFFISYTQIGQGFGTALTSRCLTNHHIHMDAKGRGIKKQLWRMGWKDVAGCFIGTPGQPVCLISVCSFQSCL